MAGKTNQFISSKIKNDTHHRNFKKMQFRAVKEMQIQADIAELIHQE